MPDVDSTLCQIPDWSISLLLISRVPFIKSLSHASRWNTAAWPLRSVGSGCMPVQRWACLTQKLRWRNSCVVYLETLSTTELLLRSPTIYTAEPTHQRSYCTTGNECSRPSPSATSSNSPLPKLSSTPNLLWSWAGFETTAPSRPPRMELLSLPFPEALHLPPPPRWWIVDHHRRCC